jgi:hypothetical protein
MPSMYYALNMARITFVAFARIGPESGQAESRH